MYELHKLNMVDDRPHNNNVKSGCGKELHNETINGLLTFTVIYPSICPLRIFEVHYKLLVPLHCVYTHPPTFPSTVYPGTCTIQHL